MSSLLVLAQLVAPLSIAWVPEPSIWIRDQLEQLVSSSIETQAPTSALTREDWAEIRASHEAALHAIHSGEEGHHAENPGQGLRLEFDGRGSLAHPTSGEWSWGLELQGYGFASAIHAVGGAPPTTVESGTLTYEWDDTLSEWYINDDRGLEHGFTIERAPEQGEGREESRLFMNLRVRGSLAPQVTDDARSLLFLNENDSPMIRYAGLTAFDADQRTLPARITLDANGIRIEVETHGARYPLTIDPIAQTAYLKGLRYWSWTSFGSAVAVSGNTAIIGVPNDSSTPAGINGDPWTPGIKKQSGSAYIFERGPDGWAQTAYIKASNSGRGDNFGGSVDIDGDLAVVGAPYEESRGTGVNGFQNFDGNGPRGAAYLFRRALDGSWSQEAYLKPKKSDKGDEFGGSVAVSGNRVAIGSTGDGSSSAGVNGDPYDNSLPDSGAVYVFEQHNGQWRHAAFIKASNPDAGDIFGAGVAMDGDTIVVGAAFEDSGANGVNGNQADNGASNSGAAYVFRGSGLNWTQEAYIKASNTGAEDGFGRGIDIDGDRLVVAARGEDSQASGVDGDQGDDSLFSAGAVYVFVRSGTSWSQEAYLKASNPDSQDAFGTSVAIDGDRVAVGASGESSDSRGINGDEANNSASRAGAAYIFERTGGAWGQSAYLKASNAETFDRFGASSAVAGDLVLVGASSEEGNSPGVNGLQQSNAVGTGGAVYAFDLDAPDPIGIPYCLGDGSANACPCAGLALPGAGCPSSSTGGATLSSTGTALFEADSLSLSVSDLPPSALGILLAGTAAFTNGNVLGDGLLCLQPQARSQVTMADAAGNLPIPTWDGNPHGAPQSPAYRGATTNYQLWYRDAANACSGSGFNFSNGLAVLWQ